jgi:hypothetical protein
MLEVQLDRRHSCPDSDKPSREVKEALIGNDCAEFPHSSSTSHGPIELRHEQYHESTVTLIGLWPWPLLPSPLDRQP